MARARAELTWERTAQTDARALRTGARGARERDLDERATRPRTIPWHPERHAASSRAPRAARLRARSLRPGDGAASPPGTLAQLAGVGGCVSQQATLGCTAARGLDDARAVALSPTASRSTPSPRHAREPHGVQRRRAQRPAAAAQPLRRLPRLDRPGPAAAPRARSKAPRRRGLARRPARLRRRGRRRAPSRARAPAQRIARAARRHRRLRHHHAHARLRHRAVAGRRRCDRDLARRALRLRRRASADSLIVFSRDAATGRLTPLAGRRRLPARRPQRLHARQRRRLALGDRDLAGRHIALRHLDRRDADLVPARREHRGAHPAAARTGCLERRSLRRLRGDRRARPRLGRHGLARRHHRARRERRRRRGAHVPARPAAAS